MEERGWKREGGVKRIGGKLTGEESINRRRAKGGYK